MDEYIEREALLEKRWDVPFETEDAHFVQVVDVQDVVDAPAADVAPVRHGSIIETIEDGRMKRVFSCCRADFTEMTCWMTPNYCPNCGAKMDLEG